MRGGGLMENTSGQGAGATIPPEARRWNWGAFLLGWIWGLGNSVYVALLTLVPLVNIVMIFVLGAKGGEWAWRNKRWESVDHFVSVQKKWAAWGLGILIVGLVIGLLSGLMEPSY
jgi:hypothetical protein